MKTFDLIIQHGQCITPNGVESIDIGIANGQIRAFGTLSASQASETFDAKGLHVLPGVIDSQVHFREPGMEHKEDLETGTRSAALGGVTAIFEMPNTNPSTTTKAALEDKLNRASQKAWVNYAFFMGACAENADKLHDLERIPGCVGVKIFMGSSTGSLLVDQPDLLKRILENGRRRVAVHCENEMRLQERKPMLDVPNITAEMHEQWRDAETAYSATKNLLELADKTKRLVHVLHVTTKEEMELLAKYKHLATVEVTPQHLTLFSPDCYDELGTYAQMNPPIRSKEHQDGLWRALEEGIVDVIGSDHAPHTKEEKSAGYPNTPSGMPGVQTILPLMLHHHNQGKLSLLRLVDLLCASPARIYGAVRKGRIAVGYDADFTVVDLKKTQTIESSWLASRCGWSPFENMQLQGWPEATIIDGSFVMKNKELLGNPQGKPVTFFDTLRN